MTTTEKGWGRLSTFFELRLESLGLFLLFLIDIVRKCFAKPYRIRLVFQSLHFIGNESLIIIIITGFFTGGVFGLQIAEVFLVFRSQDLMGAATGSALVNELAPLVVGFLLAGRVGAAMTAEISNMVVTEQVDAMEAMGIDPIQYLVVPRVVASILFMPLLCIVFIFVGMYGAYVVGINIYQVDAGLFFEKLKMLVTTDELVYGLRKMTIFSAVISTVACWSGLNATGGSKGVGVATTSSVIKILLSILLIDLMISYFRAL